MKVFSYLFRRFNWISCFKAQKIVGFVVIFKVPLNVHLLWDKLHNLYLKILLYHTMNMIGTKSNKSNWMRQKKEGLHCLGELQQQIDIPGTEQLFLTKMHFLHDFSKIYRDQLSRWHQHGLFLYCFEKIKKFVMNPFGIFALSMLKILHLKNV